MSQPTTYNYKDSDEIKELSALKIKLKPTQLDVINEILNRDFKKGSLSLPLGFGKTIISLCLALMTEGPVIGVVSLTLLSSWCEQIKKFFGDDFKYEVLYKSHVKNIKKWTIKDDTKLVLTTPEVIKAQFKELNLNDSFAITITPPNFGPQYVEYVLPTKPMSKVKVGPASIYSINWGMIFIDEGQNYNNITSEKCRSISCLYAKKRYILSGTPFNEPKPERFLGYFVILHLPITPPMTGGYTLPDMTMNMFTKNKFAGYRKYTIYRDDNKDFVRPKYTEQIISHNLNNDERNIFINSRLILQELAKKAKQLKQNGDVVGLRKFNAYILGMISYVRQCVINPAIPMSKIIMDIADFTERTELSEIVATRFTEMGIKTYFDDDKNVISTRFAEIFKVIEKHSNEKIIIFSSYRTCIDLLISAMQDFIKIKRKIFTLEAKLNDKKRGKILEDFEKEENGILAITYNIGSEGLNLQSASTVLLVDLEWNSSKIKQAIGRINRPGQLALEIFVYFFVSNTGMEHELIKKNRIKDEMLKDLALGSTNKKFPTLQIADMLKIINTDLKTDLVTMRNTK